MIDFDALRPTDESAIAIAAALDRCLAAGKDALAELNRLKVERARLLMVGDPEPLAINLPLIERATADARAVNVLINATELALRHAAPDHFAERNAPADDLTALSLWVSQNAGTLIEGACLLVVALRAWKVLPEAAPAASEGPDVAGMVAPAAV